MPNIPGVPHRRAVAALLRAGYRIEREGRKHIIMTNGTRTLVVPRNDPIDGYTLGGIVSDAGLTPAEFRKLL